MTAVDLSVFGAKRRFKTLIVDPPWRYQKKTEMGIRTAEAYYPTMTTDEMVNIDVGRAAEDDAHLYVWVTNPLLLGMRPTIRGHKSPVELVRAWGFEPKSLITWVKTTKSGSPTRGGMGWYFRGATEHVIFAVKGNLPIPPELRQENVIMAPKGDHSAKPDALYEIVERVSPGPYAELFARKPRDGWFSTGLEMTGIDYRNGSVIDTSEGAIA